MMINPPRESLGQQERKELVEKLLHKEIRWLLAKSPYYKELVASTFGKVVSPEELLSREYWQQIPLLKTLPTDPFTLITGPISNVMRFTKGLKNGYFGLSQGDLAGNLDMVTRALAANNINKTSIVALVGDYTSQGCLDLHYGAEALGATVLPCKDLADLMAKVAIFHPDTVIGTAEIMKASQQLGIHKFILVGEELPRAITPNLGFIYRDGVTGCVGWIFSCEEGHYHVQEDYLYTEVVEGELVCTPLTLEVMPLLRISTGIKVVALEGNCTCGRTFQTYSGARA